MKGVLVTQVRKEQEVCSEAPRFVSLMLLIVITATLATIHSEAFPQPESSPTQATSISEIQFEGSPLSVRNFPVALDQIDSGSLEDAIGQVGSNNANSHVAPMEENIQQQPTQDASQSKTNEAAIQFSYSKPDSLAASSDLSTSQSDVFDNNGEPIISETNLGDLDQQLKVSGPPAVDDGNAQMQEAVRLGPLELSPFEAARESESFHEAEQQLIGRRFGLLKKGHHQNSVSNQPSSNPTVLPLHNEYCERCLSFSTTGFNGATWRKEPTIRQHNQQKLYRYPHGIHNETPSLHQFESIKSKLSKLQFSKRPKSELFFGRNTYQTPAPSRIPHRSQWNNNNLICISS